MVPLAMLGTPAAVPLLRMLPLISLPGTDAPELGNPTSKTGEPPRSYSSSQDNFLTLRGIEFLGHSGGVS